MFFNAVTNRAIMLIVFAQWANVNVEIAVPFHILQLISEKKNHQTVKKFLK